jgi:hypothetical protein
MRGYPVPAFGDTITDPNRLVDLGQGFGLPGVYAAWTGVLSLLYPLPLWLEAIKCCWRGWCLRYL